MKQDALMRRIDKVLPGSEQLVERANQGPLKVYLGIDPTGANLHLGHTIGLQILTDFAKAGHEAILLFGTGTVLVGDPSQRATSRKRITQEEIDQNIQTWKEQVAPIIDFDQVKILQNGDWITKMTIHDIINVSSHISATQLFKRESFTRRIDQGDTVWYHETMYPLLQGYDSVHMDVDAEIGGTDQEFNMLMGRELQKKINSREKFVITNPMILGTDGRQMSKSSGNCVWLKDDSQEMFGKLMSIVDSQIIPYLTLCTDVDLSEISQLESAIQAGENPRDAKLKMAYEVTKVWHGQDAAEKSKLSWQSQFSQGNRPESIDEFNIETGERDIIDVLVECELAESKSAARRLVDQGAVRLNDQTVESNRVNLTSGDIIQAGKRRFASIK